MRRATGKQRRSPVDCRLARWQVCSLLAVAVVVRGTALWILSDHLLDDTDGYLRLARNVVATGTYGDWNDTGETIEPTAYRPPLYPLALAACLRSPWDWRTAVACLHLLLGVETVLLTCQLGQQLRFERAGIAMAALLVAADPILLEQSTRLMTETMATLLTTLAVWCLVRAWYGRVAGSRLASAAPRQVLSGDGPSLACVAAASGGFVVAALCRPVFLATWAVVGLVLVRWRQAGGPRLRAIVVYGLVGFVGLAPWLGRNVVRFSMPIVTTTHGGYTFHLGNNPSFYAYLRHAPWGAVWHGQSEIVRDEKAFVGRTLRGWPRSEWEPAVDRYHYRQAIAAMAEDPWMFARSCIVRLGRLWQLVPHQVDAHESDGRRAARYAVGGWYGVVTLLALAGAWQVGRGLFRPPWVWGTLLVLSVTGVHVLYWTNMRMRAPLIPQLDLLAGWGMMAIGRWRWRERSRARGTLDDASMQGPPA